MPLSTKPLVSVVIAAYNVATYLEQCVKSIISQSYQNLEILIVNDESTDQTKSICLRLCRKYPQIHYFEQPHSGQGPATNLGINNAKGKYLMICDGDDYYLPEAVNHMVAAIINKKTEVVVAAGMAINPEGTQVIHDAYINYLQIPPLTQQEILNSAQISKYFPIIPIFAWSKIYDLKWLHHHHILFPQVPYFYVDNPFHCFVLAKAKHIGLHREQICVHRTRRPGSTTEKINADDLIQVMLISRTIIKRYRTSMLSGFYHTLFVDWKFLLAFNPSAFSITQQLAQEVIHEKTYLDPETKRALEYYLSSSLVPSTPFNRFLHSPFQRGKTKLFQWFQRFGIGQDR